MVNNNNILFYFLFLIIYLKNKLFNYSIFNITKYQNLRFNEII